MKLLKRGAESVTYLVDRFGLKAVLKRRIRKRYMHPKLDLKLRRERTLSEARTLHRVKSYGVRVPYVYDVDPENFEIVMEFIEGDPIYKIYDERIREGLGRFVGLLHANDEIHGDLNVSNVIVREKVPYIIDFGLAFKSSRVEDKADDIHTLRRSMLRIERRKELRNAFLRGYRSTYKKADEVIKREAEIWRRGRYVRRERSVREL